MGNDNVVHTDNDNAKLRRADEVLARAVLKQRFAMFAKIKALRDEEPVSEESALDLWEEVTQVAKGHEAFDLDEDTAVSNELGVATGSLMKPLGSLPH